MQIQLPVLPVEAAWMPAGPPGAGDGAFAALVGESPAATIATEVTTETETQQPDPVEATGSCDLSEVAVIPVLPEEAAKAGPPDRRVAAGRTMGLPGLLWAGSSAAPTVTESPPLPPSGATPGPSIPSAGDPLPGVPAAIGIPGPPMPAAGGSARAATGQAPLVPDSRSGPAALALPPEPTGLVNALPDRPAPTVTPAPTDPLTANATSDPSPRRMVEQALPAVVSAPSSGLRPRLSSPMPEKILAAEPAPDTALVPDPALATPAPAGRTESAVPVCPARTDGPAPPPAPTRQIAAAVASLPEGGTEIRLDPAELGHVRLSLQSADTSVTLVVHADRPETADLIRRNLDSLTQDLRALGYQDVGVSVSGGGADRGSERRETAANTPATRADGPARGLKADIIGTAPPRTGGLDLRL